MLRENCGGRPVAVMFVALLFAAIARAQSGSESVAGSWHVAIRGWGIEDHLLVLEQDGGRLHGKFEFADVSGTIQGARLAFDVTDRESNSIFRFQGTVSGDKMNGTVTSPKDGPILRHGGPGRESTTAWTGRRERKKGRS